MTRLNLDDVRGRVANPLTVHKQSIRQRRNSVKVVQPTREKKQKTIEPISFKPSIVRPIRPIRPERRMPKKLVSYNSLANLNHDLKQLMDKLPTDIDLVAGIPRCGMIPATLLAIYWNLPLTDIYTLCEGKLHNHLVTPERWNFTKVRKVLVIDDTIASGRNMAKVKAMIKEANLGLEFVYAVIYATERTKNQVDYYVRTITHPRMWEWDLPLDRSLKNACVDMDGILCRNPSKEEQSTPERLSEFYKTVKPWLRPPKLDTIITGRLEQYRPETEAWLAENGIKYNNLIMLPQKADHAQFKAGVYRDAKNTLFVESGEKEAAVIRGTGKQVIVPFHPPQKLKLLVHTEITTKPAGAGITICTVAGILSQKGHSVRISQPPDHLPYIPEHLRPLMTDRHIIFLYREADIIMVHWRSSQGAIKLTKQIHRPRVHFFCDRGSPERLGVKDAALLVFNSYWLMNDTEFNGDKMVIYPPVYSELYQTTPGDGILLVAAHQTKGIDLFLELAGAMPDRKFVLAEGRGREPPYLPSNVELIKPTLDPRDIYSKARLVLMPSREGPLSLSGVSAQWVEGYGRVAIEAATSGIPTIGSRESVGLQECLGPRGMFAGQDDLQEWIDLIIKLDDKDFYAEKSDYALRLSQERESNKQINEFEERLIDIYNRA